MDAFLFWRVGSRVYVIGNCTHPEIYFVLWQPRVCGRICYLCHDACFRRRQLLFIAVITIAENDAANFVDDIFDLVALYFFPFALPQPHCRIYRSYEIIFLFIFRKKIKSLFFVPDNIIPYYFIFILLTVFLIRMTFLESVKNKATDFIIQQSERLMQDIEAYKKANGQYPVSLLSTID